MSIPKIINIAYIGDKYLIIPYKIGINIATELIKAIIVLYKYGRKEP